MRPDDLHARELIGQGPGTRVYRALGADGESVVLKTFSLTDAPGWKAHELFGREAKLMQGLQHPCLPRLLSYGSDEQQSWLIFAYIPGESLAARLEAGWHPDLAEVTDLARQLLELLVWLHERHPPVIHRDIKPSNLILAPDQQLYLIDFGSVLLQLKPGGGSTVAGTFGYMAPEQFSGRALPQSDLYSTGATLIQLLTGLAPSDLPQERLWLRFEDYLSAPESFKQWLRSLIHPLPEERCPSARQALETLERTLKGQTLTVSADSERSLALQVKPPAPPVLVRGQHQTAIETTQSPEGLIVRLPARKLPTAELVKATVVGSVVWMAVLVTIMRSYSLWGWAGSSGRLLLMAALMGLVASLSLRQHRRVLQLTGTRTRLVLSPQTLSLEEDHPLFKGRQDQIAWQDISAVQQRDRRRRGGFGGVELFFSDARKRRRRLLIGQTLSYEERAWLTGLLLSRQAEAGEEEAGG